MIENIRMSDRDDDETDDDDGAALLSFTWPYCE